MSLLVVGGAGCLGRAVLRKFLTSRPGVHGVSVDLVASKEATESIILDFQNGKGGFVTETSEFAASAVRSFIRGNIGRDSSEPLFDTVVCTAGAWCGGFLGSADGLHSVDRMLVANLQGAVTTAYLATQFLNPGGLVVFSGADAALKPTPSMIGYGMAKAAVHHLAISLASSVGEKNGGLPDGARVATILPGIIDTPANRKGMPNEDFKEWVTPEEIANIIDAWSLDCMQASCDVSVINNGSFHKLVTIDGVTKAQLVDNKIS